MKVTYHLSPRSQRFLTEERTGKRNDFDTMRLRARLTAFPGLPLQEEHALALPFLSDAQLWRNIVGRTDRRTFDCFIYIYIFIWNSDFRLNTLINNNIITKCCILASCCTITIKIKINLCINKHKNNI
jgi:hypothetical protein